MKSTNWTKKDCFIEDPLPSSASLLRDSFWRSTSETESARFHQHLLRACCSRATRLWTWFAVLRPPFTAASAPALAERAGCLSLGSSSCKGSALRFPSYTAKLSSPELDFPGCGGRCGASLQIDSCKLICLFLVQERGPQLPPRSGGSLLPLTFLCRFDELLNGVRVAAAGSGGHVRWGAVLPRVGC